MAIRLPTLSSAGFVRDPAVVLERQLAYFFVADYSQSNQHADRVSSLPYLIKGHAHTPSILIDRIQSAVEKMLSAYFDGVDVIVSLKDPLSDSPQFDIILEGTVTQEGKRFTMAHLLNISNSTLKSVSELQIK